MVLEAALTTLTGMTMARNSTVQMTTATFSPMLMPAFFFCADPLLPRATIARMRAGMEKARQMSDKPQQSSVKMEKTRAQIAIPELSSAGGDT